MQQATKAPATETWVSLHVPKTRDHLRKTMQSELKRLLPQTDLALLVHESHTASTAEIVLGDCPLKKDETVARDDWLPESATQVSLRYGSNEIGTLILADAVSAETQTTLEQMAVHYATALVNLELRAEALRAADSYCASVQAFEEGVVLFQEQNFEAVGARFLDLCTTVLKATAGAVYVLEDIGNVRSPLRLDHMWGLPGSVLEDIVLEDGTWYPATLLQRPLQVLERGEDGRFDLLDNDRVHPALDSLVAAPLHYHGVDVGVCTLFNIQVTGGIHTKLESAQRLFELGAAVFHRRQLEEQAMQSKQIETQLEIASTIQKRLIPTEPPCNPRYDFAWSSQPAQSIGGDYVDLLDTESDVFAVIADISGHGINSALLMTSFRASCRAAINSEPDKLLTALNQTIKQEVGDTGMFLTAAALRMKEGRVRFASAGHNPVYLYRAATEAFDTLDSSGPPLGFFEGMSYELEEFDFATGDVLTLYTDGIVEATSANGEEMYGDDRLLEVIRTHATEDANAIRDAILASVDEFTGGKPQEDDISVLIIRFVD